MSQGTFEMDGGGVMARPDLRADAVYHVGVSGGKDSAAALLFMVHLSGVEKENIRASFCDTGNEHEWTLAHVRWLSENVHPIETIYPERGFYELALQRKRFPSACARFCTEELKIIPTAEHILKLKMEGRQIVAVSGVRGDESADRSKLSEWDFSGNLLCYNWRPLIRWCLKDVFEIHNRFSVPLNPLYSAGAKRVGCFPCIMSRKDEVRNIALNFPERIARIREQEGEFLKRYGRYSSFFAFDRVPLRFRSFKFKRADGSMELVCTIDDVVKWSMTGRRARGSWKDEPAENPLSCNSGYCE